MKTLQEASDDFEAIMAEKKRIETKFHPQPGVNTKRRFPNSSVDVNYSPVDIEKYSRRKPFYEQVPHLEVSPDSRFEPFNCFPDIASKYSSIPKNAAPLFDNYSSRRVKKFEPEKQNQAQVQLDPNKEYVMYPLTLGFNDFDKHLTREHREEMLANDAKDKQVISPDFYTHHDNAT